MVGCHWPWIMLTNHKIASGAAAAGEETERALPMCQCKYKARAGGVLAVKRCAG